MRIPHVSVADDMCFITEVEAELEPMMSSAEHQANREHYTIHPIKTVILKYNAQHQPSVSLYDKPVHTAEQMVHLGIYRHTNCNRNIDENINLGRRTAYSLMGVDQG